MIRIHMVHGEWAVTTGNHTCLLGPLSHAMRYAEWLWYRAPESFLREFA